MRVDAAVYGARRAAVRRAAIKNVRCLMRRQLAQRLQKPTARALPSSVAI